MSASSRPTRRRRRSSPASRTGRRRPNCCTSWGAKEIMITHNSEVLVYDGREIYTCPIRSRNLSGRTGRGDTTFAGYINERLTHDVPTALRTATALVSLKMETPGPFLGTRADVEAYQREFF